jgi:pilus biogenesis lipoprotein CpaD
MAQAGPCGLLPEDIGPSARRNYFENQPVWYHGCSTQRNLAAMVDNPADLVQPREETPSYTPRARRWLRNTAPPLRRRRIIRMPMSPKSVNSAK